MATVTVYWRPGCGFCSDLVRRFDKAGLAYDKVNIWEDEAAAEFVRSVADGTETVPTVTFGDETWVNPKHRTVLSAVKEQAPELLATAG